MIVVAQTSRRFRCFVDGVVLGEGVHWSTSSHCGSYRNFAVFGADRSLERRVDDAVEAAHKRLGLDDGEVLVAGNLTVLLPVTQRLCYLDVRDMSSVPYRDDAVEVRAWLAESKSQICPACAKDPDPRGWSACADCRRLRIST